MSTAVRAIVVGLGLGLAGVGDLRLQAEQPHPPSLTIVNPAAAHAQAPVASPQAAASAPRALIDKYCVACHNEKLKTAGLNLHNADVDNVGKNAEIWEKVVRKLRTRAMPPAGSRRPDEAAYDDVSARLEVALDRAANGNPNPGRPAVHRLNRLEYTNAIRDLLALEIDGRALLPTDESGYGFDNIADVLSVSPGLLERYLLASQRISRRAIGNLAMRPAVATYRISPFLLQEERMSEDLPFGTRGGTVIRHHFPLDGEYALKINLRRAFTNNMIRGLQNREQLDVRLDGGRVKLFTVGGECIGSKEPRCVRPPGLIQASPYELTADDGLEVHFSAKAGTRQLGITFMRISAAATEGAGPVRLPAASSESFNEQGDMTVDNVRLEGPFNPTGPGDTPSRQRIFVCRPAGGQDAEACARKILSTLARRAYRRPVTDRDVQLLLKFYRTGQRKEGFEAGVQAALEALLVSPHFLLRVERDPVKLAPGTAYRLSDLDLASRLSFFLWSSIPDDQLLNLAGRRRLSEPRILEQQVLRMLNDARAATLVSNFAGQWLYLRDMRKVAPDPRAFPDFDDTLREAFQRETELFLESQMREDRPLAELLTANYTFVNERLARFYGIPNVSGNHFRRVTLTDPNRAGLLGHASLLTVTSYSTRTSPVVRGKYLLTNILGSPPPAPPPDVPALQETGEGGRPPATVRNRLEEHRKNPVCAGCHARMDPMGFALENFNAIGKWRTKEGDASIDATGAFPDGTKFGTPAEFRNVLLRRRDEFVRTFIEKLLTYALGRGVEYYDTPAIRKIMRDAAPSEYRWTSLILGVTKSLPFQMKAAPKLEATLQTASDAR